MPTDPRSSIKTYLETYINPANLTRDDGSNAQWVVIYGRPLEELKKTFLDENQDLVFTVEEPETKVLLDEDQIPYGYEHRVPIRAWCIDKYDVDGNLVITGTKLKWKAESELRSLLATYPTGSQYGMETSKNLDQQLDGDRVYGFEFIINYRRSITA